MQKDLLPLLSCDIKIEVGIRDKKKELGSKKTLVCFGILVVFLIENV